MLLRILTAAVLIPVVVALVWYGPPAVLAAAAAVVAILALLEFFKCGEAVGLRPFEKWTIVSAGALFYAQYSTGTIETHALGEGVSLVRSATSGVLSVEAVFLLFLFGCVAIGLAMRRPLTEVLGAISISSSGLIFVILPFSYIVRIHEIPAIGRQLVLLTLCLMWAGDTLAYFVGRSVGRLPMAPILSPKKTWEGAAANFLGSLLVAMLFARWMQVESSMLLIIAGLANIGGQMGDLIESAYKRAAHLKDSGSLLPGHGGMLDRIDSLILASPVVWLAYQWLASR